MWLSSRRLVAISKKASATPRVIRQSTLPSKGSFQVRHLTSPLPAPFLNRFSDHMPPCTSPLDSGSEMVSDKGNYKLSTRLRFASRLIQAAIPGPARPARRHAAAAINRHRWHSESLPIPHWRSNCPPRRSKDHAIPASCDPMPWRCFPPPRQSGSSVCCRPQWR